MGFEVDFDGVVADTAEAFIRLCCEDYGYCSIRLEDITHFEVERCLDMDPEIVEAVFTRILLNSVEVGLKPMDGAVHVLEELTAHSQVTLVTARPHPEPVREWLETSREINDKALLGLRTSKHALKSLKTEEKTVTIVDA